MYSATKEGAIVKHTSPNSSASPMNSATKEGAIVKHTSQKYANRQYICIYTEPERTQKRETSAQISRNLWNIEKLIPGACDGPD